MEQMHIILKRLRKEKGLSQDALAELLGISAAAVSKWENAVTMPDISQIVPLTNIFGVSADELFGIGGKDEAEEIDKILYDLYKLQDTFPPGDGMKIVEAYKAALKEHPKNITLLSASLSFCTTLLINFDLPKEVGEQLITDCTRFAELIMKYADSEDEITHAKRCLIDVYCHQGNFDGAIAIAEGLPKFIFQTRDITLARILCKAGRYDEEKRRHVKNIGELMSLMQTDVIMLANRYKDEGNYEDALVCYGFANTLLDALYGEEKYRPPFVHRGLSHFGFPAQCLIELGREEEALDLLEAFAEHYLAERAGYNVIDSFDSPLLRGKTYRFGMDGKAAFNEHYQDVLDLPWFAKFKEDPRFIKVVEKLQSPDER